MHPTEQAKGYLRTPAMLSANHQLVVSHELYTNRRNHLLPPGPHWYFALNNKPITINCKMSNKANKEIQLEQT